MSFLIVFLTLLSGAAAPPHPRALLSPPAPIPWDPSRRGPLLWLNRRASVTQDLIPSAAVIAIATLSMFCK